MLLSRCSISYSIQLIIAKKAATNRQVAIFRSAFALFITYSIRASRQKRKSFIEFYKKKRPSRQLERFLIDCPQTGGTLLGLVSLRPRQLVDHRQNQVDTDDGRQ